MEAIGPAVRELRAHSPYRDIRSFAAQTGLSYEGLRKIELGERIPSVDTLTQIIRAVDIDEDRARALYVARDLAHAKREKLLDKGVTDEKIAELSANSAAAVVEFLGEFDMGLEAEDQEDLASRLTAAITETLRA